MRSLLILGFLLPLFASSPVRGQDRPETWPVVHSEVFRVEGGEIRQIPLSWDGIRARRFHLRLESTRHFDATVTRVKDGEILFSGRFEPRYAALIHWGRDEYAHLTLWSKWSDGQLITLNIATDPEEEGLAVYSMHLNRFLEFYAEGEFARAERALSKALMEDPEDSLAQLLWSRMWEERGVGSPPETAGNEARAELAIRDARAAMEDGKPGRATGILQAALPTTRDPRARFAIYRELARLNRELGNPHQVELVVEQVLLEFEDPELREEAESWRP